MSLDIDASSLLIYRAAWTKDNGAERITKEAAMAKLFATEVAQRVIDEAVQIFGGSVWFLDSLLNSSIVKYAHSESMKVCLKCKNLSLLPKP